MFEKLLKNVKDALFPSNYTCDICGVETFGTNLCADCLKTVTFNNEKTCPICGRKTVRPEICLECKMRLPLYKKAVSPLVYNDGAHTLISNFKNGSAYLKEYFADLIAEKLIGFPKADCIVYVPMTKKAERARGYNQTELLAKSLSKRILTPVLYDAVIKVTPTPAQKDLTYKERAENLKGTFKVKDRAVLKEKTVLIVDDILTTGATADEMCRVILAAGAKCVYLATVASVEYKQSGAD